MITNNKYHESNATAMLWPFRKKKMQKVFGATLVVLGASLMMLNPTITLFNAAIIGGYVGLTFGVIGFMYTLEAVL